jgi:hypothetical protein
MGNDLLSLLECVKVEDYVDTLLLQASAILDDIDTPPKTSCGWKASWGRVVHRVPLDFGLQRDRGGRGRGLVGKEGAGTSGAERLPREELSITTLAHIARGVTEKKWQEHLAWVKERCHGKRYVVPPQGASAYGSIASRARKTVALRFYQFRIGKTRTGPYLTMLDRQKTTSAGGTAAALLRPTNTRSSTAAGGRANGSPCGGTLAKQLERAGSGRSVTPLWHSSSATKDAPQPSWSSSHKRRWLNRAATGTRVY